MHNKKSALRQKLLQIREGLNRQQLNRWSETIVEKLRKCKYFQQAKTVMFYYPVRGEVNILPLVETVLKDKTKRVLFPKITTEGELIAIEVPDMDFLRKGKYGIPEPIGGKIVKPEKIDLVIVPAVAFDTEGNRLGMGKGFYDRFLPRIKGKKIGVAYDFQIVQPGELPVEPHDSGVDIVITPQKIYKKEAEKC